MEKAEGKHFLVMELVEGETPAERLRGGQLSAISLAFKLLAIQGAEFVNKSDVVMVSMKWKVPRH